MKILRNLLGLVLLGLCSGWLSAQSTVAGVILPFANGRVSATLGTITNNASIDNQGNFSIPVPSNSSPVMGFTPPSGSPYAPFTVTVFAGPGITNITQTIAPFVSPTIGVYIGLNNQASVGTNAAGYSIPGSAGPGTITAVTAATPIVATPSGSTVNITCPSCGTSLATVQSVAVGDLAPLFTTAVSNPTTTASAVYTLSNAAQNSVFAGPATGGAGAPSYQTAPTFSAANLTNFPTFNQNTTANAATATNISTNGTGLQVWGMNSGATAQGWQTISAGGGPTLQTNGASNTSQSALNLINSTANSVGLSATVSNPTGGSVKVEIGGSSYSGNATTATTAANLSGTPALPNGTTATTQTVGDSSTKLATDAFVLANLAGSGFPIVIGSTSVAASSTTTTVAGLTVDGVTPTTFGFVDPTSSVQTQLNGKAPLASPALTGTPTAPTAALSTNTTQLATTAFVIANAGVNTIVSSPKFQFPYYSAAGTSNALTGDPDFSTDGAGNVTATSYTSADASGVGGGLVSLEGTARTGVTTKEILYASSALHRYVENANAAGDIILSGVSAAKTSGHCAEFATNGVDLIDAGSACGAGSSAFSAITSGTNTTAAMVLGTGASMTVSGSGTNNATSVNSNTFPASAGLTSGGVMYASSTSAVASSALLTNNQFILGGGAGAAPKVSLCDDGGTTANTVTCTDTGGLVIPSVTTNGATAGFFEMTAGTTNTAGTSQIVYQAPTSVTAQLRTLAGTPASGYSLWTNVSGSMTETISATIPVASISGSINAATVNSNTFPASAGFTSGGIPFYSSTSAEASSALLTAHGIVVGGGAGSAPATIAVGGANFPLLGVAAANPAFSTIAYPTAATSGGVICATSTTALGSSALLTTNILVKGGGAGVCPSASLVTDSGTQLSYSGTGGVVSAPASVAGSFVMKQGTTVSTGTTAITHQAPTSVTSYIVTEPGVISTTNNMMKLYTATSGTVTTESFVQAHRKSMIASGAAYTNATATPSTVFSFTVDASTSYTVYCKGLYKAATGGAFTFGLTGPTTPTLVTYDYRNTTALSSGAPTFLDFPATGSSYPTGINTTAVTTAATDMPFEITIGYTNGTTAGTLAITGATLSTNTLTIEAGSFCTIY